MHDAEHPSDGKEEESKHMTHATQEAAEEEESRDDFRQTFTTR